MIEDPLSEDILRNKYAGKNRIRVTVAGDAAADDRHFVFEGVEGSGESKPEPAVSGAEAT